MIVATEDRTRKQQKSFETCIHRSLTGFSESLPHIRNCLTFTHLRAVCEELMKAATFGISQVDTLATASYNRMTANTIAGSSTQWTVAND